MVETFVNPYVIGGAWFSKATSEFRFGRRYLMLFIWLKSLAVTSNQVGIWNSHVSIQCLDVMTKRFLKIAHTSRSVRPFKKLGQRWKLIQMLHYISTTICAKPVLPTFVRQF